MQSSCRLRMLRAQWTRRRISEIISYSPECAGSFFGPFRTGIRYSFRKSEQKTVNNRKQTTQQEKRNKTTTGGQPGIRHLRLPAKRKHGTEYGRRTGRGPEPRNRTRQPTDPGKILCGHFRKPGKIKQMVRRRRNRPCFQDACRWKKVKVRRAAAAVHVSRQGLSSRL